MSADVRSAGRAGPLRFVVWSDYLCPWCANGSLRLQRIEQEYAGRVAIEWKSYLLRPRPRPPARDAAERERRLEAFRGYVQSWRRPAAEEDAYDFRFWEEGSRVAGRAASSPPTHSLPAQLVAKAAARMGDGAFRRMHDRLLRAYFHENRDISASDTLAALWAELALPAERFEEREDRAVLQEVLDDHEQALALGATGVPAVHLAGSEAVIVGAHPVGLYRRWIERAEARRADAASRASP